MLDFYDVDLDYINFLKQYDTQIPNISYTSRNKFVCGIVLNINGINIMLRFPPILFLKGQI